MSSYLPRVSVIIPTYNRSKLLQMAIDSVLAQTYPNIEIIVVDDGSTDDTATVMAQYAGRVTYLKQANQDVAAARNTGIRAASGEYLTFLDDDDLILPTKIARQVQVLTSQPKVGLVHCRFYYANRDGDYLHKIRILPEGEVLQKLVCNNFLWMGAPLIRRQCLEQVGLFDLEIPAMTADWDMWLRIALAGYPFACVQELLGVYRIHQNAMMSDVVELERGVLAILEKVFSNPQLPAGLAALDEQAYESNRFWLSCMYYAAGQWHGARRNLAAALALRPQLLEQPEELSRRFGHHALGPRVGDPFRFVAGVLDHLPACVDGFQRYRSHLLSQVYAGLAMRDYSVGNIADAKSHLTKAIALDPARFEQTENFAGLLRSYATYLPVSAPLLYVDTVLRNLPAQARRLGRVRARVLSELSVKLAYQDYLVGQWRLAIRRILTALRYRPFLIGRRSVVSIFLRSLLSLIMGERTGANISEYRSYRGDDGFTDGTATVMHNMLGEPPTFDSP